MQKITLIFVGIILQFLSYGQDLMTIGEVFDFDVGDKFQYTYDAYGGLPPNADRIEIIGKYYSEDSSVVFYIRFIDSYSTTVVYEGGGDPHLEYEFWTKTDTVAYSNLDSSIATYRYWMAYDTAYAYYDTINKFDHCNTKINGYTIYTNNFEPEVYERTFGKGLGLVENYFAYEADYAMDTYYLFYYKKDTVECGSPDNTGIEAITDNGDMKLFPNPCNDYFRIENENPEKLMSITLFNLSGELVKTFSPAQKEFDISNIPAGTYFLNIRDNQGWLIRKILIKQ